MRARVRAGDPDAFGIVFDECVHAVYNHAFRLTGDWSAAEEIVSLTFLEAWRLRGTVQPQGESLLPWLLGIAVNVNRNLSRAVRRHRAATSRLPLAPAVPDFADDLVGRLDDVARIKAVRRALGELRRSERDVLALCVWSGLDYADTAKALGIPVGTVRSRLSRARKKLRKLATPGDLDTRATELGRDSEQNKGGREHAARPRQETAR